MVRVLTRPLAVFPLASRRTNGVKLKTLVAQRRSRHFKQRVGPPRRETTLPAIATCRRRAGTLSSFLRRLPS